MPAPQPDTRWDDEEIVLSSLSLDTSFLFDRMTAATIDAVEAGPGEQILDLACGRGFDALKLAAKGACVFGLEPSAIMIKKCLEWTEPGKSYPVILLRGLAEELPFKDNSFTKLVCKGAIDHFVDVDLTLKEAQRVVKPGGKLIISVANFESLSCRLARIYDFFYERIKGRKRMEHPSWLPPKDHNFKFAHAFLVAKIRPYFEIETLTGLSLLWCFPYWGSFLQKLPRGLQDALLKFLDRIAGVFPPLSDVLVVRARPRKPNYSAG